MQAHSILNIAGSLATRFAICQANRIPTPTALAFNAIDILVSYVAIEMFRKHHIGESDQGVVAASRLIGCLTAFVITTSCVGGLNLGLAIMLNVASFAVSAFLNMTAGKALAGPRFNPNPTHL